MYAKIIAETCANHLESINLNDLQIPHIKLHERAFVLQPLCDINPNLCHPLYNGKSMGELLQDLPDIDRNEIKRVIPLGIY